MLSRLQVSEGSAVSVFPGWMWAEMHCPVCNHEWIGVAAVGTKGIVCPGCGCSDDEFYWLSDERPAMAHDGCWLTGEDQVPTMPELEQVESKAQPILVRLCLWLLRKMGR